MTQFLSSFFKNFLFFGHFTWPVGSWFPAQGSNPCPLHCKHGVLTTGLPEKSLIEYFKISKLHSCHHHFTLTVSRRSQFSNALAVQAEKTSQTHGQSPPRPFSCSRPCLGRLAEPQVEMLRDVSRSAHQAF